MTSAWPITDRRSTRGGGTGRLAAALALVLAFAFLVASPPEPAGAATCPCTIFSPTQTPANTAENDPDAVELGVKFRTDQPGFVTGIRFYKGSGNTGTHTGSLWASDGTRLATVTFTQETETGWQEATFAAPVAVAAGTTYVASYYAPTGRYSADVDYFAGTAVTRSPLTALESGVDGGNGVYRYGAGGGFPSSTYRSTNYWVDVVFSLDGADTTAPTVTGQEPAAAATDVPVDTSPAATFSEPVVASTVTMTLTGPGDAPVGATTSYDPGSRTATLTPTAALSTSTAYTVTVSGAQDPAGNTVAPVSWTFTTSASVTGCPCTVWPEAATPATAAAADSSAVELGVRFRASRDGYVTGIRFYKGSGNTGTHVGTLWDATGAALASVTFAGETATGWQTALLAAPVAVVAGTTYVASYHAPVGRYSVDYDYFDAASTTRGPLTALRTGIDGANGVYRYGASGFPASSYRASNYWVDVVFDTTATDTTAPGVVAQAPAPDSGSAATVTTVTATFSEDVVASSVVLELRGPDGTAVAGTVTYSADTRAATLDPTQPLEPSTAYTATVSGARDPAGNVMAPVTWSFTTATPPPPSVLSGPGGPIAVVTDAAHPHAAYLTEILRTEGLNEFASVDVGALSAATLAPYDVVVLGDVPVTADQAALLTTWVEQGGNLVAMRPSSTLSGVLGLTPVGGTVTDGYLKVDTGTDAGAGIVGETMQFHGAADRYSLSGAEALATLHTDATTATTSPAVTLRSVGTDGGQAAAFTYDLARSVVQQRQGNPAWATEERDGPSPIRSSDKFFGGDVADWVDLSKVAIPQADEQQRLLANLIQVMNRDTMPLPRFWYFPRGLEAVVVGTGDDHGTGGTAGRFEQYNANSPDGCDTAGPAGLADWSCLRFSSYVYPSSPLSDGDARTYQEQGFEVGVHPSTGCGNYTPESIADTYTTDLAQWRSNYPSVASPATARLHCIVFSDWASQPRVELANGIRMDTNYYYWPSEWIQNRPGFMTGSGMPMRFADTDGSLLDIYQATTQMTDESGQSYPLTPDVLLDNAQGPLGYYGAFVANMHTDFATIPQDDALIMSARERGVPIISARQLLTWTDGRNASSFGDLAWSSDRLSFTVSVGAGADGLTAMLPTAGPGGTQLDTLTHAGTPVELTRLVVKGHEYASFPAAAGAYSATYSAAPASPTILSATVSAMQVGSTDEATIMWTTSEPATSEVTYGTTANRLTSSTTVGGTTRQHEVRLPRLRAGATYFYRITSRDTSGAVRMHPPADQPPARFTTPALDRTPPAASAAVVSALPGGTATVTWTTTEAASSVVEFGRSPADLNRRHEGHGLARQHTITLMDLEPGLTYWYRVSSADAGNNRSVGRVQRFVTPAHGVAQQTAAQFVMGDVGGAATVDWTTGLGSVTLAPGGRGRSGTYQSAVLDASVMVDWDRAFWVAGEPAGTRLTVSVRSGSTAKPDGTWTAWTTLGASGARVRESARYLQYRVEMTTTSTASPSLHSIGFGHNGNPVVPPGEAGER